MCEGFTQRAHVSLLMSENEWRTQGDEVRRIIKSYHI
jgi:hypothetical protein